MVETSVEVALIGIQERVRDVLYYEREPTRALSLKAAVLLCSFAVARARRGVTVSSRDVLSRRAGGVLKSGKSSRILVVAIVPERRCRVILMAG